MNETTIMDAVRDGQLFGLVQCDIAVPDHLKAEFSEMAPIFKNIEVSRADMSEHMRDYCIKHKLVTQPRTTLVGSLFGKEILLITPLLRWYIEHGLEVTNIKQVIEYRPEACFKNFGDTVTKARRQGDLNPDSSIVSNSFKLIGNRLVILSQHIISL